MQRVFNPFGGIGGKLVRLIGFAPSRKNPISLLQILAQRLYKRE